MITYWQCVAETVLEECGISATPEQIAQMARRLPDAREMEGESCGWPGHQIDPVNEVNPLQAKVVRLQDCLDRLARACGVSVDPERMEISWIGPVGGTLVGTIRQELRQ